MAEWARALTSDDKRFSTAPQTNKFRAVKLDLRMVGHQVVWQMPSSPTATSSTAVGAIAGKALYHPKRPNGTFRVVSEECAQFSLEEDFEEEDNDMAPVFPMTFKPESDQPLISNKVDSDEENDAKKDVSRTPSTGGGKELSRLTDEVEIEGDSASDELDLLPPLPPSSRKLPKWKAADWLCCKSRVPLKCVIM
ncbi:hypothetical protein Tcan_09710 [Toxocara canis]|uniref:Uncharacterized protein n=1 Tax=Toxocara canis TaxID=6265 RepID=A0A0B2VG50_TOXCA|nr:hypothetical protein Tcan_09710 [Toxocara canis]